MVRVADGMACGRLNQLDEVCAGVCALVCKTSCGGVWVGVNLKGPKQAIFSRVGCMAVRTRMPIVMGQQALWMAKPWPCWPSLGSKKCCASCPGQALQCAASGVAWNVEISSILQTFSTSCTTLF
jgi:hypothetical protein